MKQFNKIQLVALTLLVIGALCFNGCKSTKQGATSRKEIKARTDYFERLHTTAFRYETLAARVQISLNLPDKKVNSRAQLKLIKDEALQLSIQPFLGIEIFRLELTLDSIVVIDRINKRYVAESLTALQGTLPIDFNFYNLQSLFTNQLFLPGEKEIKPNQYKQFTFKEINNEATLKVSDRLKLNYIFHTDVDQKLTQTQLSDTSDRFQLLWDYTNFESVDSQLFPTTMHLAAMKQDVSVGNITLKYSRMELNNPIQLKGNIPSKYRQITFAEILKMISNK
jgi:hypothetical protein